MELLKEIKRFKPDLKKLDLSWVQTNTPETEGYPIQRFFKELSETFKSIEHLDLSGWVVDASAFKPMTQLKTLILRYSKLTLMTQDVFPKLEELDLCSSDLMFDSAILSLPPSLKRLHLETFTLSYKSHEILSELGALEELSLSHCRGIEINLLGNYLLTGWPELKTLNIGTTEYAGHAPSMQEMESIHGKLNGWRPALTLNYKRKALEESPQTKPLVGADIETAATLSLGTPAVVANIATDYANENANQGCAGFLPFCLVSYFPDLLNWHAERRLTDTPIINRAQRALDEFKQFLQTRAGYNPSPDRVEN